MHISFNIYDNFNNYNNHNSYNKFSIFRQVRKSSIFLKDFLLANVSIIF